MKLGIKVLDEAYPSEAGELVSLGRCFGMIRYAWGVKRVPVNRIRQTTGVRGKQQRVRAVRPVRRVVLSDAEWSEVERISGRRQEEFTRLAKSNGVSVRTAYQALKE
jgi:hypothetical protein